MGLDQTFLSRGLTGGHGGAKNPIISFETLSPESFFGTYFFRFRFMYIFYIAAPKPSFFLNFIDIFIQSHVAVLKIGNSRRGSVYGA